ncbi:MAG: hypothetical protein ACKO04_15755 [Actinomycetes bacterium]
MAPTDLAGLPELEARIDELLAAGEAVAVLGARVDLPTDDPAPSDTVATRLHGLVRGTDLLGRVPPATFVLVAAGSDTATAELVADRLKQAFQMPLEVAGRVVSLVVEQRAVVVRPEDLVSGAPRALGERRGSDDAALPVDGAGAVADLMARLDRASPSGSPVSPDRPAGSGPTAG